MSTYLDLPLLEVGGPAAQPSGFGLYAAATVVEAADAHASNGVRWLDRIGGTAAPFAIDCPPTFTLPTEDGVSWVEVPAFGVAAGVRVPQTLGLGVEEVQAQARARLSLQESSAAEAAYWTGLAADGSPTGAPALAGATDRLAAAPVSLAQGLGLLEEWIGQATGAVGVIHAARHLLGTLTSLHVRGDGGRLRTLVGTPLAAGTGYPGSGPDGTRAAGVSWLYATGPVQVVRSPVFDLPGDPRVAVDRATGALTVHAARFVAVGHTVGVAAVPVTLA